MDNNVKEITDNIVIVNLSLYLKDSESLIISDVHIGLEEAMNKQGILVPRFQFKDLIKSIDYIFSLLEKNKWAVKQIITNGDLKHEFGTISKQEWKDTFKFLNYLNKKCSNIVLIKGNHDTILEPIATKKDLTIKDYLRLKDILITHGHKIPKIASNKSIKTIIIGHEHPAVSITSGLRTETFKAFLVGNWQRKKLIVMPSFCLVTEGTDIMRERLLSPFLSRINLSNMKAFVVGDKIYDFGKISNNLRTK